MSFIGNIATIVSNITATILSAGTPKIQASADRPLRIDSFKKTYGDMYAIGFHPQGVATYTDNPGSPVRNVSYINKVESVNRTYTNFGGITVTAYEYGIFKWTAPDTYFGGAIAVGSWTWTKIGTQTPAGGGTGDVISNVGGIANDYNVAIWTGGDGYHLGDGGIRLFVPIRYGKNVGSYSEVFGDSETFIKSIAVEKISGSPSVKIGITPGGNEILDTTAITDFAYIDAKQWFASGGTIYYEVSGSGSIGIRFDYESSYFNIP